MTRPTPDGPADLSRKQRIVMILAARKLSLRSPGTPLAYRVDNHQHIWTTIAGNENTFRSLMGRGLIRWIPDSHTTRRGWVRLTDAGWRIAREQGWVDSIDQRIKAELERMPS